jgi:hypothetical protein
MERESGSGSVVVYAYRFISLPALGVASFGCHKLIIGGDVILRRK